MTMCEFHESTCNPIYFISIDIGEAACASMTLGAWTGRNVILDEALMGSATVLQNTERYGDLSLPVDRGQGAS